MIKTATNIVKGVFRQRKPQPGDFKKLSWLNEKILKHQEDQYIKQIKIGDLVFWYKRPYELLHTYREIFEKEIYKFQTSEEKPVVIDCGSNIGLSILYYKKLYPNATIVAFEPDENNFKLLQKNILSGNYSDVHLNQAAIWITNDEISFAANESEASHISETGNSIKVKALRLRDLLANYERVEFLKIDIEGAEWQVVRDCSNQLAKVQNFFLEYHGKVDESIRLNELLSIVINNGFKIYIRNAADNLRHPFIEKNTGSIYDVQLNIFCYK